MRWTQSSDPNRFACNLGQAERVLYFNMEVACYEELYGDGAIEQRDCTVGVPFSGVGGYPAYYIKVYPQSSMRALRYVLVLILSLSPLAPKAEVLLSVNDVQVTEDDLYHYLKEFLLPQCL